MKKFFYCQNNGVLALVSEEVYNDIYRFNQIWQHFDDRDRNGDLSAQERWRAAVAAKAMFHLTVPIFTFVHEERRRNQPWFSGSIEVWSALADHLKSIGATVQPKEFFVPFSTGRSSVSTGRTR